MTKEHHNEFKFFKTGTKVDKTNAYIEDKTELINYELNNSDVFYNKKKLSKLLRKWKEEGY